MIKSICNIFSPSGDESEMRNFIKSQVADIFDEIKSDNIGNLICRSGNGGLCIECSMDSCGIMIVSVKDGKAYFAGVAGINAEYLIGKKIVFKNGEFGIVRYDGKSAAESKISDLYISVDTADIKIGDFGVVEPSFCETDKKIYAHGLGNRIGLITVLSALKKAGRPQNLCVVFSAQKRLGARGIQAFFGVNEFDKVMVCDGVSCNSGIKPDCGCSLVVADKAGVCKASFKNELEMIAKDNGIKAVTSVTDDDLCMGHFVTSGKGLACAAVAVPVEYKDKSFESIFKSDLDEAVKLLTVAIKEL